MTSSDVRDVLNLGDGVSGPRASKKQRIAAPRPNLKGLAREVHNLGGDNPIAIVPEVTHFKKRRFASRKPAARWEMRSFKNSARSDLDFTLRHWRRKDEKQEGNDSSQEQTSQGEHSQPPKDETEDSAFAKYNVQVSVPQYSEDQYQQSLHHNDWTKEETDYLLNLARDFDLRWPLIWDRYEWNPPATNGETDADGDESKAIVPATRSRPLEDLKARYYEVASKMMAAQKPVQYMTQPEFSLHELMAHFNPQQEKLRKEFALNALTRSREEAREEESLLLEIKRILARSERFNDERRELYNRLDYPRADTDINAFKSSAGLQNLLQNLMTADKSKKRKSLMPGDGTSPSGTAPPQTAAAASVAATAAAAAQEAGRRESTATSTGPRESTGPAATPAASNNKKGQQQQQERRKLTTQEELLYGVTHHERLGSGPTFRTERINKLFSHKSNQQQMRITNVLNELDVPNKLAMPTAATTHQYEQLLAAVNSLLDARKVSDKLDGEIKVEQAKKAEREKATAPPESESISGNQTDQEKDDGNNTEAAATVETTTEKASGGITSAPEDASKDASDTAAPITKALDVSTKEMEQDAETDKNGRPGSSGATHKRSASVLSSVSDKSNKRQKK
ncbi:SWR1-complex protein 4 [Fusarium austroafricanum]|uniref:SWR1-complex protein 4 n=1 Tax=Fusarium austroafricanum TaxID=2364996 RepID=A0A8H4P3R4_9HYPO|nr:SWR1-complex protein 4 [Fusarium austroafricanum]